MAGADAQIQFAERDDGKGVGIDFRRQATRNLIPRACSMMSINALRSHCAHRKDARGKVCLHIGDFSVTPLEGRKNEHAFDHIDTMHLIPREASHDPLANTTPRCNLLTLQSQLDKLLIAQAGFLAQRRLARGVILNHAEATVR